MHAYLPVVSIHTGASKGNSVVVRTTRSAGVRGVLRQYNQSELSQCGSRDALYMDHSGQLTHSRYVSTLARSCGINLRVHVRRGFWNALAAECRGEFQTKYSDWSGGGRLTAHWDPRQPAPLPPHCRYGWMESAVCKVVLPCKLVWINPVHNTTFRPESIIWSYVESILVLYMFWVLSGLARDNAFHFYHHCQGISLGLHCRDLVLQMSRCLF
jgi:hypothetical protein